MKALRFVLILLGGISLSIIFLAFFERLVPRRVLRWYQKYVGNPLFRGSAGVVPGWAAIETIGRRTGKSHRVPVGGRLADDTYWLLASTLAQYVRNIEKNPKVRVRVHGRWRDGVAHICPDDDPRRRLLRLNPVNGFFLWLAGTDLLTVRIDLQTRNGDLSENFGPTTDRGRSLAQ